MPTAPPAISGRAPHGFSLIPRGIADIALTPPAHPAAAIRHESRPESECPLTIHRPGDPLSAIR